MYSITLLVRCILRGSKPEAYNRAIMNFHKQNSDYIKHHYMLSDRDDRVLEILYKFDVDKFMELWSQK